MGVFALAAHRLSHAEGAPSCRSEPVPGEAPHTKGRFCLAHSGFLVTLSCVCMYIVLPFSSSFLLPQPKASCPAPGCSQTHQSVPRVTLGLSSAVSSGQTQRRAANCNFFFSSLFVSILFQLGVDFTLLAGKRRLPSPNFFKSNLFFLYLRNSVKVM